MKNSEKNLKIVEVESVIYNAVNYAIVTLSNGLKGIGASSCCAYPGGTDAVLQTFREYLIGKKPFEIEHHWQYLYRMGPFRGSILSGAISAIDIALWDLKGKFYEVPVWKMLGGPTRNKIRLHLLLGSHYGNNLQDNIYNAAKAAGDDGFTALKIDPLPDGYESMTLSKLISETKKNVKALRDGAGLDVDEQVRMKELNAQIAVLETQFSQNMATI